MLCFACIHEMSQFLLFSFALVGVIKSGVLTIPIFSDIPLSCGHRVMVVCEIFTFNVNSLHCVIKALKLATRLMVAY